ncbi:MAG: choice-of-anchor Q domain-containing protein, partial [Gammaproteobacteria bacterium]
GGPTQTAPPLAGSPALDAGDDSVTDFLSTDQRGNPRLSGTHVDIGAVEVQVVPPDHRPFLTDFRLDGDLGQVTFGFTNIPGADFTVLVSTNLALPLSNWDNLGLMNVDASGGYVFTDSVDTADSPQRFCRAVSP